MNLSGKEALRALGAFDLIHSAVSLGPPFVFPFAYVLAQVWGRSGRRDPLVCTAVARQLGPWAWRGFGQVPWVHAARGQSSAALVQGARQERQAASPAQQRLLGPLRHAAAEAAQRTDRPGRRSVQRAPP